MSALCFVPAVLHGSTFVATDTTVLRRKPFSALSSTAADILPAVREGVSDAGAGEEWEKSVSMLVEAVESDVEDAEMLLATALNWKGWAVCSPTMRRFMKPQHPSTEELEKALEWLRFGPLSMDQDQLSKTVKEHPKLFISAPEATYKKALGAAPKEFRDPEDFKALVLNDPSAMNCTYNCDEDGCGSECGNCWVSYRNRL